MPYEIKRYARDAKTSLAPPELLKVHPLGKSPVITDGDLTIAESGAIIEYLVDRYGKGALIPPAGSRERLRYTYWLHFKVRGSFIDPNLERIVTYIEAELGRSDWFAGDAFTAADIQMSFPVAAAAARVRAMPNMTRFLERIQGRPAYKQAIEKGGEVRIIS